MEKQRAAQVHLRALSLVEHPDLRPVADADDVPVDRHGVAGTELADLRLVDREGEPVVGHQASRS